MSVLDELIPDSCHCHQLRLVGLDLTLQGVVFAHQQVDCGQVVSHVLGGGDLLLLLDPVLLIGRVPVELPELAAVFKTLSVKINK